MVKGWRSSTHQPIIGRAAKDVFDVPGFARDGFAKRLRVVCDVFYQPSFAEW
jgi:hypothetical protein